MIGPILISIIEFDMILLISFYNKFERHKYVL